MIWYDMIDWWTYFVMIYDIVPVMYSTSHRKSEYQLPLLLCIHFWNFRMILKIQISNEVHRHVQRAPKTQWYVRLKKFRSLHSSPPLLLLLMYSYYWFLPSSSNHRVDDEQRNNTNTSRYALLKVWMVLLVVVSYHTILGTKRYGTLLFIDFHDYFKSWNK